jgi:hypothetical protein
MSINLYGLLEVLTMLKLGKKNIVQPYKQSWYYRLQLNFLLDISTYKSDSYSIFKFFSVSDSLQNYHYK